MKMFLNYILILLLLFTLISCKKIRCDTTFIEAEIVETNNNLSHCLTKPPVFSFYNEYVIRSKKELNGLLKQKNIADFCEDYNIPEVNFLKYSLLGKLVGGAIYCDLDNIKHSLTRNCKAKTFTYTIEVNCPTPATGTNIHAILKTKLEWIKVPIIPRGYTVEFVFKEIN